MSDLNPAGLFGPPLTDIIDKPKLLPTAEEAFPLPTAEEAFPVPKPLVSRIPLVNHFARGFDQAFDAAMSDEAKKALRDAGILPKSEERWRSGIKEFNEMLYTNFHRLLATGYGLGEVAVGLGVPRDVPGMALEAFPGGYYTALPRNVPTGRPSPTMQRILPRTTPPVLDLDAAFDLGVIGREPAIVARERLAADEGVPFRRAEPEPTAVVPPVAEAPPFVADVHAVARQLDADTFAVYDDLAQQKRQYQAWIDEVAAAKAQEPVPAVLQREIDTILSKVNGVEERLTNRAARRLEESRDALDAYMREETAQMATLRRELVRADEQMRDLAPRVSEAYREARRLVPEEPAPTAQVIELPRAVPEAPTLRETLTQPREIRSLAQQSLSIARDTEQRLIAAGRPQAEARAASQLIAAHYEARAARFNGALGTTRELYETESPRIVGARGSARGRTILREARNTIQLMERADASTFIHETGHNWLEELRRDAKHESAPEGLKGDFETVREWLGAEGDTFTRAQHERFARGFERYIMEGQAPSTRLARVFEKFKEWLTQIYQTVARLRAPITDDIRGVYDRLLSTPSREPVIIAEREGARTWAEDAMAAVRETPAADALAKADQIAEAIERASARVRSDWNERRRQARSGETATKVPDERGGERAVDITGEALSETDAAVDAGRDTTTGKIQTPPDQATGFGPSDRGLVDKAGNIRLDNLMVSDDVAEAIVQASAEKTGFIEARRGVLADEEVIALAKEIGVDPNKLDRWAIAEAWTAEQIVFARQLLRDSATRVQEMARRVEIAANDETLTEYAVARERHMMIQERVSAVTAEAGRALRMAFRPLGAKEEQLRILLQAAGKTPGQLRMEARLIANLDNTAQTNKALSRARDPTWGDKFVEAFTNILVSGWETHAVNISTNMGVMIGAPIEAGAAGIVGKIFEVARRERGVTLGEAMDKLQGIGAGSVDGMRAAYAVIKDEKNIPLTRFQDQARRFAIEGTTGKIVRIPGRMLTAEDEFFKAVAWQQEINVLSRRMAINEGLSGDRLQMRIDELRAHPTDSMRAAAEAYADYQTFQKPLGKYGQIILNAANAHPFMRLFLPFVRTPINLFKYSAERSPLGFFSRSVWEDMTGKNGAVARDQMIARMAVGNMVAAGVMYLAWNEFISPGGPRDPDEQRTLRMTGWQPYSFNVGDLWVSYRRFDPFSNTIGLAADMAALAKYGITGQDEFGRDRDVERFQDMFVISIWRNLFDKLTLRGVTSPAQALLDWPQYGRSFVNGLVGSFVPGVLGQTARSGLDVVGGDEFEREARTPWEAVQSRIPWFRGDLFPKRDRWGEPIERGLLGPFSVHFENNDPVNRAMLELGINIAQPKRKISGVELTEQQYDDYVRLSGQRAKALLDGIVTPEFRSIQPGVQVEVIQKIVNSARAMARAEIGLNYLGTEDDVIQKGIDLQKQFLETGHKR